MLRSFFVKGILSLVGIILISAVPFAFIGASFQLSKYIEGLTTIFNDLLHPMNMTYIVETTERMVFPYVWDPYLYSMALLFSAFFIALFISVVLSFIVSLLPELLYKTIKSVLFVIESIPDVMVGVAIQFLVIWYFKQTHTLLFPVASSSLEQPYFIPILCLTILPLVVMFRTILFHIEQEWEENYILTVKGKGLTRVHILFYHILPRAFKSLFFQSKVIIWFMVSNLLVVELLFNIFGITNFIFTYGTPVLFSLFCILIFVPLFIFICIGEWLSRKIETEKQEFSLDSLLMSMKKWLYVCKKAAFSVRKFTKPMKEPLFAIGFCFLISLLFLSFYHHFQFDGLIPQTEVIYDEDGKTPIDKASFDPSSRFWFGTDQFGFDTFYRIIAGAKYTLGLALFISLLRLILSYIGGFLLYLAPNRIRNGFVGLSEALQYVPVALLCFFILYPISVSSSLTFWEKGIYQIIIMTILAVPVTSVMFSSEIKEINKQEFITGARVLGGNRFHVFYRHIRPHLTPKLTYIFISQLMFVLILFSHLGMLRMFFGGTVLREYTIGIGDFIPTSVSNEWSGMIGAYYNQILIRPYLILIPVLFFCLCLIAAQFMLKGLKTSTSLNIMTNKYEKTKIGTSLVVIILFLILNITVINKFHKEFAPESIAVDNQVINDAEKETEAEAEKIEKKYVVLNAELVSSFERGAVGPLPFIIGEKVDERKTGKPLSTKTYEDGVTIHTYQYEGIDVRVGISQDNVVDSISIELSTNRDNIMKNMNQQPVDKSSDRQFLTFHSGKYQITFSRQGDDLWWATLQIKQEAV
ncbi:ABC transporter permease subunit [Fictibacillus nanhaiensis]|uniref:ABC transporter permease subunit n=1 Tax=Fictibacillus nanhaiensis TaxID=742169 RepID=A0ABS2ZTK7_9BACL|nr:ABC transporter permease subunit [Fictibacillus nanhaiensis]